MLRPNEVNYPYHSPTHLEDKYLVLETEKYYIILYVGQLKDS